jgi:hypothetical protein
MSIEDLGDTEVNHGIPINEADIAMRQIVGRMPEGVQLGIGRVNSRSGLIVTLTRVEHLTDEKWQKLKHF